MASISMPYVNFYIQFLKTSLVLYYTFSNKSISFPLWPLELHDIEEIMFDLCKHL